MKTNKFDKKSLYRKKNTKARGVHHLKGQNYRNERNKKNPDTSMKKGINRGLDFTPLMRFLKSRLSRNYTRGDF